VASREVRNETFREMRESFPDNKACADCGRANPQWASVNNSCFFCIECSGRHRSVGVHISFVRSCTMDSWTMKQLKAMKIGGNHGLKKFCKEQGLPTTLTIEQKYGCRAMELYRERLKALLAGTSPPNVPVLGFTAEDEARMAPKPQHAATRGNGNSMGSGGMGGGGNKYGSGGGGNKYGSGGSSMSGFGGGGPPPQNDKASELLSSLSTGFFSAASYTTKAASAASAAVVQSSTQAVNAVKSKTDEVAKQDIASNLKTSASSGWGSFAAWAGSATSMLGEAASSLTDAVVGDGKPAADGDGAFPTLYKTDGEQTKPTKSQFDGLKKALRITTACSLLFTACCLRNATSRKFHVFREGIGMFGGHLCQTAFPFCIC
jgi:hypothetical protein